MNNEPDSRPREASALPAPTLVTIASAFPSDTTIGLHSTSDDFVHERADFSSERNASPSAASTHSTLSNTTSSTVPRLKRKLGHKHMREQLQSLRPLPPSSNPDPATLPPVNLPSPIEPPPPAQVPVPGPAQLSSLSSSSKASQVFITRSHTAPSPRRPPASHSSYGVGTTAGPPPSFDTRRTTTQERVWRIDRSKSLRMTLGGDNIEEQVSQQQLRSTAPDTVPATAQKVGEAVTPLLTQSSPDTADTQSIPTPTDVEDVTIMEFRSEQGLGVNNSEVESKSSSESHKSEDLFLNIARTDAGRPSSSKGEKRRSRVSLPFLAGARPATSHHPDTMQLQTDSSVATPRAELPAYQSKRSSLQFGQLRGFDTSGEQDAGSNSGYYSKRSSTLYADTIKPIQRSSTVQRSNRLVSDSGYVDKPKYGEQNTTESTASTTAPSTVWDELDDLKSRIRKLELTGKLPPSSAAAMSSAERPRTATTAATTMSSSPKHNKMATPLQSTLEGVSPGIHPLLHEALGNAKAVVSHDVYQKLQATAQDALQLASLTSFDGTSVRSGAPPSTDRQIRRRTESMCRSLTELAIALAAESKPAQPGYRPPSRDYHVSPAAPLRSRRHSQTNDAVSRPPVTTRVQSRLESRRTSTQYASYMSARHTSPDLDSPTALPQYPGSAGRPARLTENFRSRRYGNLDGAIEGQDDSPSIRPVSRAMTDVAPARKASRDHAAASREYTSQYPMPAKSENATTTRTPLPASLTTNFISRRKNLSPDSVSPSADSSPLAPRQSWGRISVIHQDNTGPSDTVSEAPSARSVSTRRSLGFASRLGSSVGNRLRAARTERVESRSYREAPLPVDPASIET